MRRQMKSRTALLLVLLQCTDAFLLSACSSGIGCDRLVAATSHRAVQYKAPEQRLHLSRAAFSGLMVFLFTTALEPAAAVVAGSGVREGESPPARDETRVDGQKAEGGRRVCDEKCKEMIKQRREMMRQSKSTSSREEVLDLSRQRAKLYGVESKAASCIKGLPCL